MRLQIKNQIFNGRKKLNTHFRSSLALIIFLTISINAQWNRQSPAPTHLDIRGISAPTAQHVFIATDDDSFDEGGALFESTDGGNTWVQRNVPFNLGNPLNGLFFLNSQLGWAYGNGHYRTTDGGTTWTELPMLGSTYFLEFYTPTFGLTTGNFERYVSYDAGDSWVESPNGIFSFDFNDNLLGLGISDSGIYRTTDGGNNFVNVYNGNPKAVAFLSASIAVAIVDGSFIRSTDGGINWSVTQSSDERKELAAVSENVILAYGRSGIFPNYDDRILRSTDGGQTWNDLGEVIPAGVFAINVNNQNVVISDYEGNMFLSTNSGLNWNETFSSPGLRPSFLSSASPFFADSQTGYFGYGTGYIIKTTDGGASWFQISSGIGHQLNDIDRFENGNMIAVGDNGTLLTSNGTSPWVIHNALSQYELKAVQVIGPDEAVVLDEEGFIFSTTDGGNSWAVSDSAPTTLNPATDLYFTSLLDGYVVGYGAIGKILYHTANGGNNWTLIPTDFGGSYKAIDVKGSNIWVQNVGERYYYSFDNGESWTMGELPGFPFQIADMEFFDESIGYAVGYGGYAARTDDGGVNWEVLPTPNNNDNFTDIYIIGANEIWLSTNDDAAYYTGNGGQNWAILPIGSQGFGSFSAIAASPDGDAWTVGFQGYIEHFSGPPPPPLNRPPDPSFEFTTTGLTVDFHDTSTDPDGFIVSWRWNFADGTSSTQQNPTHTFDTANTYIVRLTVTDEDGDSSTTGRVVVVQPLPGGVYGNFTEVTPFDSLFLTPQDEDFWVITSAPADFDSDGDLDIAVLGYYVVYNQSVNYSLVLLRNDGPAGETEWEFSYVDVPLDGLTAGSSDLAWGDMDSDGDLDLALGTDGQTVLYRNDLGTLVLTDTELPGYYEDNDQADYDLNSISWADFDNDGDFDLLIPSVFDDTSFTYRTALMRNDSSNGNGGRVFTEISVFDPTSHAQSSWADFDNDQDLDLLLINLAPLTDDGFIKRYRNDGNGVFVGEDILGTLTVEHGEAQWGDYDGDGDLDILVAGNIKDTTGQYLHMALRIYENVNDNFIPFNVIECIPCEGWFDLTAATWADYDSDGDIDILLAGTHNTGMIEGRAQVYINDGNGNFTQSNNELPAPRSGGAWGGVFSWLDIDEEGDLDYFIAGEYFVPGGNNLVETQMHIYRNDVAVQNNRPSPPTQITVNSQSENSVHFSWIPAVDDNTPSPAITYDLVVVRSGTHTPTKMGDSTSESISARLPEPGNISAVTEWAITNLPDGEYEWRIRAVDAAYVGSDVASGIFTIGKPTSVETQNNIPVVHSVEQNYPNPFNPTTTIRYSVPKEELVTLKVYNIIGEEVATLVNGIKQAGNYNLVFDASNFSSGVYLYRLQAGNFTQVRKMIITK